MYDVLEVKKIKIPAEGIECIVAGRYYHLISENDEEMGACSKCYIKDRKDRDSSFSIYIPEEACNQIIENDQTFGMLVGGDFSYYDLDVEIHGTITYCNGNVCFKKVDLLTLRKNELSQTFEW